MKDQTLPEASPRACWIRLVKAGRSAVWELAKFHTWDLQPEHSGAVVETIDGRLMIVTIDQLRFKKPLPSTKPVISQAAIRLAELRASVSK